MRDSYTFEKDLTTKNARWRIELELDPEELQAIGHVNAQWAFLEFHILEYTKLVCEHVLKQPLPKEAESDSLRKRKRTWETVIRTAFKDDDETLGRLLKLVEQVGSLQGDRQKLIHGLIQWDSKDKETLNIYSRDNPRAIPWRVDAKKIEELAIKIATLNSDFLNAHNGNPDFPNLIDRGPSSQGRRGTLSPAEIPPEFAMSQETLQAILKRRKQSSGD